MDTCSISLPAQRQWSSPSSDSEFYSVSSPETISPAPSVDFNCSPTPVSLNSVGPVRRSRRARLKNPSEQRQSASEKEKLRMRDLTKALHHLRTYLPPSVAPVGQTLTKIETLRLTIRYISHLSAQLGLSEEYLSQRQQVDSMDGWQAPPDILGYFQCRSTTRAWGQGQEHGGCIEPPPIGSGVHCTRQQPDMSQYHGQQPEPLTDEVYTTDISSLQQAQCAQLTQSCQVYGYQLVPHAFWS
uniref:BHLH domain-containing protein n=1 Tax=Electrophorus electricus TaxID=8005 RepID=A0AAY5EYW8_ELEEL